MNRIVVACLFLVLASCGSDESTDDPTSICQALECADVGVSADAEADEGRVSVEDMQTSADTRESPDTGDDVGSAPTLTATESHEADILYGWVAAGQPSEERVREVVETGATIISLRLESEDPFDEVALIDSLGGTFIRYPTTSSNYDSMDFREAMYDLYDEQLDAGNIVYLHCASSNRVGASWALYQAQRKGVPAEEAIEMGKDAGLTSLESRVRQVLGL